MSDIASIKKKYPTIIELLITILIVVLVNIFSWLNQPQISYNSGQGMDGVEYFKVTQDISQGVVPKARAPFVYRLGTPALVATFFPNDFMLGFRFINILASSLIPIALLFWISLYYNGFYFRIIPVALFSLTWHSPLRMSWYYPVHSDPLAILFLMILLITLYHIFRLQSNKAAYHKLLILFSSFTFFSVIFREICLIPAALYFLSNITVNLTEKENFLKTPPKTPITFLNRILFSFKKLYFKLFNKLPIIKIMEPLSLLPLLLGMVMLMVVKFISESTVSYSFAGVAYSWIYRKSLLMYIHAWLIAFGPVLFILIIKYRTAYQYLRTNKLSAYFLVIIAIMGLAGGSDTERILFWAMPVVYLMFIDIIFENREIFTKNIIILILTVSQVINMRLFWATPDYPNKFSSIDPILTPIGSSFPLLDLWTWHADLRTNLISFGGYLCLFVLFLFTYKYYERKSN